MRKYALFLICISFTFLSFAQVQSHVQWNFSSKKINATTYEVHLTATIDDEWHVYSQNTPDGGPVPTSISFTKNPLISQVGEIKEVGKLEKHFEPLFGVEVRQFSDKVDFVQIVTVKAGVKTSATGSIEFMTCNDHECMPPKKQSFSVLLN